ncbi:DNA circularization protein [Gallibacterium sp. AGMB14963]|uniref:DNA circularization protein n=1 Tax=Gallibacterium faecale TaxID=3019086 RepID=UPI0022F14629|nr:DNA circularization N-terminal domain-containing protein [Gallibacterium sp. AGMB14963]MDA3978492.1 DNA circularization N-terminal domain-containing protein [Gallibacterium sp. AGMB14963]
MGWTVPIRQASFRGVKFDVITVDDSFERDTVEHAYPYVNGADIEDLGLTPRTVTFEAIFNGPGYLTDVKRLLAALQKPGADTLTHPIFGRMQNMICRSMSLRHDADYINYASVGLTFVETTPAKPIFLFEFSIFGKIDALLSMLEDFVDDILDFYAAMMEVVSFAFNVKDRLLGAWGGIYSIVDAVSQLIDDMSLDLPTLVTQTTFQSQSSRVVAKLANELDYAIKTRAGINDMIDDDIVTQTKNDVTSRTNITQTKYNARQRNTYTTSSTKHNTATTGLLYNQDRFNDALNLVRQLQQVADDIVTGKNDSYAREQTRIKSRVTALSKEDVKEIDCAIKLISTTTLAHLTAQLIADEIDNLLPAEIEYMITTIRTLLQDCINTVRTLQKEKQNYQTLNDKETARYTSAYRVIEQLRQISRDLTALAINAINQKPPIIIREAPITGTLQQIAHAFYQDYTRTDDLLRLNPQIINPNFIEKGALINGYTV